MKKLLVLCVLGVLALRLGANPYVPNVLSRVWFDYTGDCNIQFGSDLILAVQHLTGGPGLTLTTGAGSFSTPASFNPPINESDYPININISELIPGFSIDPLADSLYVLYGYYNLDALRWGHGDDYGIYLHPLGPDQAAVHVRQVYYPGETFFFWAKENGVDLISEYETADRCTYNIHVSNLSGDPVPNHPVFFYPGGYPYYYQPTHYTDANGNLQIEEYARRCWIGIRDWNYNVLFEQHFFPEPDQIIPVNVIINSVANEDPLLTPELSQLAVYPNVISARQSTVHISFLKAPAEARLYLYDLKGREMESRDMSALDELDWNLPELCSGVYFVALKSGTRELGRQKLIVIK